MLSDTKSDNPKEYHAIITSVVTDKMMVTDENHQK